MAGLALGTSAVTRRWAAELCLADDYERASAVLGSALVDLGFEVVDAIDKDPDDRISLCWSSFGGTPISSDDPFLLARGKVLSALDPSAHQWLVRQTGIVSQDDFLNLNTPIFTAFMHLPQDFGLPPWRTKVSVPYRYRRHGFSIGMGSSEPFDLLSERLGDVRFLTNLYCKFYVEQTSKAANDLDEVELSAKQIECLRWAVAGKSYCDIAEIVGISERTVRHHLVSARDRYGFATITQTLVQAAKQFGLDPLDPR